MTATSGPGFSLGQEAMSYMCGGDLAGVVVDIMRPGPGDGDIMASQGDYYQVTRGGGHGDYRTLVLAPYCVQELCDLMQESFALAQKYHNPVVLVSDGNLAKLRESVELPGYVTAPRSGAAGKRASRVRHDKAAPQSPNRLLRSQ